jgi:hypothetical protein
MCVQNAYNTLHGGAVAAVAEAVGMACARAAAGDKEIFLGELSTAYLAAARADVSFSDHILSTVTVYFFLFNSFDRNPSMVMRDRVNRFIIDIGV